MSHRISIVALFAAVALSACATTPHSPSGAESAKSQASERAPRIVEGDLTIANSDSLEAFEDLEIVTGTLTIVGNTRLSNLDGLRSLRAVGHLVISENLALHDIEGLAGLRHARTVTITKNPRLENLQGLGGLRKLERLEVSESGIFGTNGVERLGKVGDLVLTSNARLLNLDGFEGLSQARNVTIVGNPRLAAQSGLLSGLARVNGRVEVRKNSGLHPTEVSELESRLRANVEVASR